MAGYSTTFTLAKPEWIATESVLGELFEALAVQPERENDPHSPETVTLFFEDQPDQNALQEQLDFVFTSLGLSAPRVVIEALPDVDWLQHVYDSLKPIEAGRFFVHGSHITEGLPQDRVNILIEAASAFGTGEHPSTKGCLLAFDRLLDVKTPTRILDMGCGSGILAIAAARTIEKTDYILGVDIDPGSVRVAENHARDNKVDHRITMAAGDGFRTPIVQDRKPYDLVFANILAQPLMDMAWEMGQAATGDIIMAGFTQTQKPYVLKAYEALGFVVTDTIEIGEWVTLWLTKN